MPTLYEYLADSTRAKYPLESLDPKAARFLSTEVPEGYPQARLQRILGLAEGGLGRFARSGGVPAPAATPSQALARQPGTNYATAVQTLEGAPNPFGSEDPAAPEPTTFERLSATMPEGWRPNPGLTEEGYRALPRGAQIAAQAAEAMGHEFSMPRSGVPAPQGGYERAAAILGGLAGFIPKTAALGAVGVPAPLAVGGSMAASSGSPKERLVRGVTGAATAGVAGAAGKVVEPFVGPAGHMAASAVGFGAAQPAAESLTMRLTGDANYPAPTLADLVRGTAEMGAVNLLFAVPGMAGRFAGRGASRAEVIPESRRLEAARAPKSRQLAAAPAEPGPAREMPAGEGAPPAVFPPSRRLPGGPLRSSSEVFEMGAGKTVEQNRAPVVAKLAPEFANDNRPVAAGRTVSDVFHEMVQAEAGDAPDRAAWKAAVRKVVASGRIQAVQDVAAALAEPADAARRGATPQLRAHEARFTEEINARAAGRTMTLNIDGQPTNLRIARVAVFRYPGEERPVRVIVEDVSNGRLFPLRFRNVAELSQAANNPQALVKSEDVFARAERQRAVKAREAATAGTGASEGAPAAAMKAAAPAAPPAAEKPVEKPEVKVTTRPSGVKIVEVPREILGSMGKEKTSWRGDTKESFTLREGPQRPIAPEKADEYTKNFADAFEKEFASLKERGERRGLVDRLKKHALESDDPVEKRAALAALERIRGGKGGSAGRGGTGRQAPPPAPAPEAKPERKRVAIGQDFSDPKKAQAVAEAMNRAQPDLEAAVVVKRGKPVVEVNEDAAVAPPKEKPAPKAEPAAAPAAEESPAAVAQRKAWLDNLDDAGLRAIIEQHEAVHRGERPRPPGFDERALQHAKDVLAEREKAAEGAAEAGRPAGGASEPPAAPAAKPERGGAAEDAELEAASKFKRGERVMAPNEAIRKHDLRDRIKGEVIGWERGKNGEARIRVRVRRGKSWQEYSVPEDRVGRLRNKVQMAENRKAEHMKLAASMEERAAGSAAKARALQREWEAKAEATYATLEKKLAEKQAAEPNLDAKRSPWYVRARSAQQQTWKKYMRGSEVARELHDRLVKERFGEASPLHQDVEPFFSRNEDRADWVEPLREVAEDFPEHFAAERQARYLHRAAGYEIPNAREWKAAIDFERGMAERGVAPEHAARAADETMRIRRMLEQDADNPLMDDAERAAARERWLAPERIDTPEALAQTLKEFDAEHPQGPADDIPAGVMPEPPEGFAADLGERGMARAELLAPWLWLKALRDVPKNWAKARRNIPKDQRRFSTYDGSGNLVDRGDHMLYEPDYYSESAMTRLLAHLAVEPGAHVFTHEQRTDYKASISDQAHLETFWHWRRVQALGKDLAEKLRPYSKLSKQLDRVLEGRAPESSLPADVQPAVKIMRDLYADYWEYAKARYAELGMNPPTSKLEGRYVGPRLILGHISQTVERMFADFLKEGRPTPEVTEMRNRFLHERTGDPVYREDSSLRWEEYNRAMSKHLAFLGFFERLRTDVRNMEVSDTRRASAIVNMLKATLLRRKGSWERWMDRALSAVRFARSSPDIREVSVEAAAQHLGVDAESLRKGSGVERAFVVPEGGEYRVGNDAKATVLKRLSTGESLVGTGGAHLFGVEPKLRAIDEGLAKARIRAGVAVKGVAEKVNRALTGEEGGYLSPHFSKDEHVRMAFEEWKDGVLRSQDNMTNAAFRAMGDRQTRAMLAGNWRAALANSMQPWLTLAPEIGYRNTLQAVIENALSQGRGKRAAEHVGSLQGELARTGELKEQPSWLRKVASALGGMAPYKYAEDFTRGVGMMGAGFMAKRLGYKPAVAQQLSREIDARYFDEWQQKIRAMRESGTTENLQATIDTETMFDYNLLGQSPIFGGVLGKVLGRLMTFPGRYARRYVTRPLGGAAKVARALALGGVDRATGGALERAGMKVGAGKRFVRGRQVRGLYPGPRNAFEDFLEHYGARYHDRQGARVFLRQVQTMGAMAALTGIGINAFLMGTPGWERLPLMALLSLTPKGSKIHEQVKNMLVATQRSAVIDPERGVESTMSPGLRIAKKAIFDETTPAVRKAMKLADEGKPLETAAALSGPLVNALREVGLEYMVPGLIAIRRGFQQMPWAEQFFKTDAGKGFAHVMGIKTYIKGNGAIGFIKGMTGLTPVAEEEAKRTRVDEPKKKVRARRSRRARGSIYSAVVGSEPLGAFA